MGRERGMNLQDGKNRNCSLLIESNSLGEEAVAGEHSNNSRIIELLLFFI